MVILVPSIMVEKSCLFILVELADAYENDCIPYYSFTPDLQHMNDIVTIIK